MQLGICSEIKRASLSRHTQHSCIHSHVCTALRVSPQPCGLVGASLREFKRGQATAMSDNLTASTDTLCCRNAQVCIPRFTSAYASSKLLMALQLEVITGSPHTSGRDDMDLLDKTALLERPSPPLPQDTALHADTEVVVAAKAGSLRDIIHRPLMIPESIIVLYRGVQPTNSSVRTHSHVHTHQ